MGQVQDHADPACVLGDLLLWGPDLRPIAKQGHRPGPGNAARHVPGRAGIADRVRDPAVLARQAAARSGGLTRTIELVGWAEARLRAVPTRSASIIEACARMVGALR